MEHVKDVLADLHNYSDEMSISQVVRFFERHGMDSFTKTMIQNYVRIGAIPAPVNKRIYRREHLIMLTLLDSLKNVYSLDEIKKQFTPLFENGEDGLEQAYNTYLENYGDAVSFLKDSSANNNDRQILILKLMAHSAAAKQLAKELLEKE